ncbi:MAG TPA: hypothetical protein VGB71_02080, partial [Flavisolibacter sp.]
ILIPLVFSFPFGPEETYGNFSLGLVYGHSYINYGFNPSKSFVRQVGNDYVEIPAFNHNQNYASFGGFINAKIGYKYAYIVPSLSMYYQNYGTYNLFNIQQERFKGLTVIPSIGLQFNIGQKKKGERNVE